MSLTCAREAADDLAQSTVSRALEQSHRFVAGTHLDRWLFVMARRLWLNDLRRARVRREECIDDAGDTIPSLKPTAETNIFARQVLMKIMDLGEEQRSTVMLVYVEGLTYREAADILEVPIGTIMSRLAAARRKLQELTNEAGGNKP